MNESWKQTHEHTTTRRYPGGRLATLSSPNTESRSKTHLLFLSHDSVVAFDLFSFPSLPVSGWSTKHCSREGKEKSCMLHTNHCSSRGRKVSPWCFLRKFEEPTRKENENHVCCTNLYSSQGRTVSPWCYTRSLKHTFVVLGVERYRPGAGWGVWRVSFERKYNTQIKSMTSNTNRALLVNFDVTEKCCNGWLVILPLDCEFVRK